MDSVYEWAKQNNMEFNHEKIVLLRYGDNDEVKLQTVVKDPRGQNINPSNNARDLGVIMDHQGTFVEHVAKVTVECRRLVSMIFRSFQTREETAMKALYKSLVLSKIDYCSPLYMPMETGELRKLEKIQFDFTLRIEGMKASGEMYPINYWKRLESLKLYSIERRQERYAAMYVCVESNDRNGEESGSRVRGHWTKRSPGKRKDRRKISRQNIKEQRCSHIQRPTERTA